MNILIINNGTSHIEELKRLVDGEKVEVVEFGKINSINYKNFDLIILSGSSHFPILSLSHQELYPQEIELILNSEKPILGVCLGFELIAYAFGATMNRLNFKELGIVKIRPTNNSPLFKDIPSFEVYEAHRWTINEVPIGFDELARSKDGVEVFQHKNRKVFGFQFHPEMFVEKTCGDEIFYNLLNLIK
jgi:GMP synthase-like glutamine amidotransferase